MIYQDISLPKASATFSEAWQNLIAALEEGNSAAIREYISVCDAHAIAAILPRAVQNQQAGIVVDLLEPLETPTLVQVLGLAETDDNYRRLINQPENNAAVSFFYEMLGRPFPVSSPIRSSLPPLPEPANSGLQRFFDDVRNGNIEPLRYGLQHGQLQGFTPQLLGEAISIAVANNHRAIVELLLHDDHRQDFRTNILIAAETSGLLNNLCNPQIDFNIIKKLNRDYSRAKRIVPVEVENVLSILFENYEKISPKLDSSDDEVKSPKAQPRQLNENDRGILATDLNNLSIAIGRQDLAKIKEIFNNKLNAFDRKLRIREMRTKIEEQEPGYWCSTSTLMAINFELRSNYKRAGIKIPVQLKLTDMQCDELALQLYSDILNNNLSGVKTILSNQLLKEELTSILQKAEGLGLTSAISEIAVTINGNPALGHAWLARLEPYLPELKATTQAEEAFQSSLTLQPGNAHTPVNQDYNYGY